jgi:acylpyruvate hydrolase
MRIAHFEKGSVPGIAADDGSGWHGLTEGESGFPGALPDLIAQGADLLRAGRDLLRTRAIDLNTARILPPVPKPVKSSVSASTTMITSRKADSRSRSIPKFSHGSRRV